MTPPPPPANKLAGIELLRFTAAVTVLIAHYCHFYIYGYTPENFSIPQQPLFHLLSPFYSYGTRAVEVFWCISGFIFCHKYGESIYRKQMPAVRFFWLRFSRLYPLHFATLLAVAVLQYAYRARHGTFFVVELNDLRHFILHLLFASNWGLQQGFSFNAPVWSVSLEVLAYGFFFVATYLFGVSFFMVILWLGGCLLLNHLLGYEGVFVRCLFYFYLGGLTCLCHQFILAKLARLKVPLSLAALLAAVWAVRRFEATQDLDLWLLDCAVPLILLVFALNSNLLGRRLGAVADTLGNLTYSSYLIHFPFQILVMLLVGVFSIDHRFAASPLCLLGYLAAVLLLAHAVYRRFELPAQARIRQRCLTGRKPVLLVHGA